jgi:hypothetical protein
MDPKIELDSCAKQAELAYTSFHARREHARNITFGVWALILLTTKFVLPQNEGLEHKCIVWLAAVLIIVVHVAFVWGVWRKNDFDQKTAYYFSMRAGDLITGRKQKLDLPPVTPVKVTDFQNSWKVLNDGWSMFQIVSTTILCVGCALVLTHLASKPCPSA